MASDISEEKFGKVTTYERALSPSILFGKSRKLQFLWIFAVVTCVSLCSIHTNQLVNKFLSEGVISTYNPRGIRFQFPDVFLCPEVLLAESLFFDVKDNNPAAYQKFIEQVTSINALQKSFLDNMTTSEEDGLFVWETMDWLKIVELFGHQKNQTITHLVAYEEVLSMTFVREVFQRIHKRCFLIRLPKSTSHLDRYLLTRLFMDTSKSVAFKKFVRFCGITTTNFSGIRLYLVAKGTLPSHETEFIRIRPGFFYDIRIRMEQNLLYNSSSRPCYIEREEFVNPFNKSKNVEPSNLYSSCVDLAFQRHMVKECGCYSLTITRGLIESNILDNVSACFNVSQYLTNGYMSLKDKQRISEKLKCYLRIKDDHSSVSDTCKDVISCNTTRYTISSSHIPWPDDSVSPEELIELSTFQEDIDFSVPGLINMMYSVRNESNSTSKMLQIFRQLMSEVIITPMQFYSSSQQENLQYPITNLLSDFGGVLSLYLGVSILSVIHIFHLIHEIMTTTFFRRAENLNDQKRVYVPTVMNVIDWESNLGSCIRDDITETVDDLPRNYYTTWI